MGMSGNPPARVRIRIDRLVLSGFHADRRTVIARQLRLEFARLLTDPHNVAGLAQSRHLDTLRIAQPLRLIVRGLRR
jgi:hypothetical protein